MTLHKSYIIALLYLLFGVGTAFATNTATTEYPPKREIRAAWVATVWAIDWPNSSDPQKQQQQLMDILDRLKAANMNTAFFQVRGFSDAMYNSAYEPWSKYLTGKRGGVPEYDPLALAVEYAHSIGMELHAWVNPYRYSSSSDTYSKSLDNDYAKTHPEWLMNSDSYSVILNPGIPEVRDQIAKVVADIVTNYDVDGVLFDDYFYLSGSTQDSQDQEYFEKYNPDGLSRGDWRRQNVNKMVRQVYDTIKAIKPYCRFGISPAGVAATSEYVAAKYGVDPAPVGSDWQYNGIYSDPLAWLSEQSIDYISPQIYWPIGSSNDYDQLCNWWSIVANKFGRHFYSSSSLSDLKAGNLPANNKPAYVHVADGKISTQGMTDQEAIAAIRRAPAATNAFYGTEIGDQIALNRAYDRNGATGSVFYGLTEGLNTKGFMDYLKYHVFTKPALQPDLAWSPATEDIRVSNIQLDNNGYLRWNAPAGKTGLRYAVYAFPEDQLGKPGILASSQYLVGVTYSAMLKVSQQSGYLYAVTVFDRYAHEHTAVVMGKSEQTITAATLTYPEDKGTPLLPCYFSWKTVDKADSYLIQISENASFDPVMYQYETAEPTFYSGNVGSLEEEKTYYWRVRTRAIYAKDTYSAVYSFTGKAFNLVSPESGASDVIQTPMLICDSVAAPVVKYVFEIATAATFADKKIVLTATTDKPRYRVSEGVLAPSTKYYLRAKATFNGITTMSSVNTFQTLDLPTPIPEIVAPLTGDTIFGTEVVVTWKEQDSRGFRVELSSSESFPPRSTKSKVVDAFVYTTTFTNVEEGTYYLRIKAGGTEGYTEPSPVQQIVVKHVTGVEDILTDTWYVVGNMLCAPSGMVYSIYTVDGRLLATNTTQGECTILPLLDQGVYLLYLGKKAIRYQVW